MQGIGGFTASLIYRALIKSTSIPLSFFIMAFVYAIVLFLSTSVAVLPPSDWLETVKLRTEQKLQKALHREREEASHNKTGSRLSRKSSRRHQRTLHRMEQKVKDAMPAEARASLYFWAIWFCIFFICNAGFGVMSVVTDLARGVCGRLASRSHVHTNMGIRHLDPWPWCLLVDLL
jgi:hypothetical protein